MKLLIKYPTRGRPELFMATAALYAQYLSGRHECRFIISVDGDDRSMVREPMMQWIAANIPNVLIRVGSSSCKVEAVNRDIPSELWDILIVASDDMIPRIRGYDDIIATNMQKHFPDLDGCLRFNDGRRDDLNTIPIMGRKLYEQMGYIYHEDYISLFCDNEFQAVTERDGKSVFINQTIIEHEWRKDNDDSLMKRNEGYFAVDQCTFLKRQAAGFPKGSIHYPKESIQAIKEAEPQLDGSALMAAHLAAVLRAE